MNYTRNELLIAIKSLNLLLFGENESKKIMNMIALFETPEGRAIMENPVDPIKVAIEKIIKYAWIKQLPETQETQIIRHAALLIEKRGNLKHLQKTRS